MKKINKNILIATGGTGGHIFPSLSLAKFLSKNYNLQMVSDNRGLKFLQNTENMKVKIINSDTIFKKNFLNVILGALKIITAFIHSVCFLIYSRPNLIIGMGGLAQIMKNMGFKIQGSDMMNSKNVERCKKNWNKNI